MLDNQAGDVATKVSTSEKSTNSSTMLPFTLLVSLATFNVRGLGNEVNLQELDNDCDKFHCDIISLQETKVLDSYEQVFLDSGNKLIVLNQTDQSVVKKKGREQISRIYQRGIGFMISKRMLPCVTAINQISDNVAYVDFELPSKSGKVTKCRLVNAYGPTTPTADDLKGKAIKIIDGVRYAGGEQIVAKYYSELRAAVTVPINYELFLCGDFNAKLGKLSRSDIDLGITKYVGRYSIGTRNPNGSKLLDFLISNDLFASNTAFQHKSRHLTTRTGRVKDWTDPSSDKSKDFYSMIDYVICRSRFSKTLVESRAYGGTRKDSDHKLVCGRFQFKNRHLTFPQHTKSSEKYDCNTLSANSDLQTVFSDKLSNPLPINFDANPTKL